MLKTGLCGWCFFLKVFFDFGIMLMQIYCLCLRFSFSHFITRLYVEENMKGVALALLTAAGVQGTLPSYFRTGRPPFSIAPSPFPLACAAVD